MRPYFLVLLATAILASCGNNTSENTSEEQENYVSLFLNQSPKFAKETNVNPIETFSAQADKKADKSMKLTKDNIDNALKSAKKYNYAVVVVENHTIVRLVNYEDCQQSGSWNACMPKGEGYIKRGKIESQNDHINNLIGKPDNQQRMLYLFK